MPRSLPRPVLVPAALAAVLTVVLAGGSLTAHGSPGDATATAAQVTPTPTGCVHRRSAQVRRGPTDRRRVALTFDDGPGPLTTSFLKILERERVPATFFVIGAAIPGREATLRRILAGGSTIGNHSFTHRTLAPGDARTVAELRDTQQAVRAATGFTPCLMRPPYGLSSSRLVEVAAAEGLTSVLWSVNPQDFTDPGAATIRDRVLKKVRPGAIVIGHDGGPRRQTLAALPGIIRGLKARGYRFVTVSDLLGRATLP